MSACSRRNSGFLVPLERRLAAFVLPRIPRWLETYHLTLLSLVWSLLMVVSGYLAARDLRWLWATNLMIVLHYFTDHFDGKLGMPLLRNSLAIMECETVAVHATTALQLVSE